VIFLLKLALFRKKIGHLLSIYLFPRIILLLRKWNSGAFQFAWP